MRPLSQHARSPPRPCCANLKPANPVERTPCLRLTLSPRGTSTACAPCSKRTRALSRSRKNSTSISWRCRRPSCRRARSISTCPAITKPGATPSAKAIRAPRSLAARSRYACCAPTRCALRRRGRGRRARCPSRNRGPRLCARVRQVLVCRRLYAQRAK